MTKRDKQTSKRVAMEIMKLTLNLEGKNAAAVDLRKTWLCSKY